MIEVAPPPSWWNSAFFLTEMWSKACHLGSRAIIFKKCLSLQLTHSGPAPLLFPPPGLQAAWKSHLLFQTESSLWCVRRPKSYSVNRGNLRALINASDPVEKEVYPSPGHNTTALAGRQAGPGLGHPPHSHITGIHGVAPGQKSPSFQQSDDASTMIQNMRREILADSWLATYFTHRQSCVQYNKSSYGP